MLFQIIMIVAVFFAPLALKVKRKYFGNLLQCINLMRMFSLHLQWRSYCRRSAIIYSRSAISTTNRPLAATEERILWVVGHYAYSAEKDIGFHFHEILRWR